MATFVVTMVANFTNPDNLADDLLILNSLLLYSSVALSNSAFLALKICKIRAFSNLHLRHLFVQFFLGGRQVIIFRYNLIVTALLQRFAPFTIEAIRDLRILRHEDPDVIMPTE